MNNYAKIVILSGILIFFHLNKKIKNDKSLMSHQRVGSMDQRV